jgi:hemerythrin-like domain-containing protein
MSAIDLLKRDHREVISFIDQLETADDDAGTDPVDTEIFNKLNQALKLHARIEEDIFYPAMEKFGEMKELMEGTRQEHHRLDQLLTQLSTIAPNQKEFQSLLTELKNRLESHINGEELEIFPKAEEFYQKSELDEMGLRMIEVKTDSQKIVETMREKRVSSP